jgi:hypothetical protein
MKQWETFFLIFILSYLSDCSLKYNYNDVPLVHDQKIYNTLKEAGIKELTAKHVAHLFIRFASACLPAFCDLHQIIFALTVRENLKLNYVCAKLKLLHFGSCFILCAKGLEFLLYRGRLSV